MGWGGVKRAWGLGAGAILAQLVSGRHAALVAAASLCAAFTLPAEAQTGDPVATRLEEMRARREAYIRETRPAVDGLPQVFVATVTGVGDDGSIALSEFGPIRLWGLEPTNIPMLRAFLMDRQLNCTPVLRTTAGVLADCFTLASAPHSLPERLDFFTWFPEWGVATRTCSFADHPKNALGGPEGIAVRDAGYRCDIQGNPSRRNTNLE
jgi:hypothetical protein